MPVDAGLTLALTAAACAAGFVDAIAGGGGLITIPALLLAGASPIEAVATNKLQGTFGVATASYNFWRAGHVDLKTLGPAIVCTGAGAALGSLTLNVIDPSWLSRVMPLLLIAVALYFAFAPPMADDDCAPALSRAGFAAGVAGPLGFYDGLFGPGTGSFFVAGFVMLAGAGLLRATANTKVLNFTSNLISLAVFIVTGHVNFLVGLPMAVGQAIGARLGSHAAMTHGAKLIRPLIVVVSTVIAIRLLMKS